MNRELLEIMQSGKPFRLDDPAFQEIIDLKDRTLSLSPQLNASTSSDQFRDRLSDIIGSIIDKSTTIFAPFYTCLLHTSPSPRDRTRSRMPSSA